MRNSILLLVTSIALATNAFNPLAAQVPTGIPYQAVARNASGNLIVSQPVGIRFRVLSDTPSPGTIWFEERHSPTTTDLGQINLTIGAGTLLNGNFSTIPWEHSNVRLQVDMDPSGGTSYSVSGITVFGTVPYAFRSGSVDASSLTGTLSSSSLPSTIAYKNVGNEFSQGQFINAPANQTALTITSAPGQTAPLTMWFDNTGSGIPLAYMSKEGMLVARAIDASGGNFTSDPSGAYTPLRIWAANTQFDPLTEWRSSTGSVLASVSNTGVFTGNGSGLTNLSIPASGITGTLGISNLPTSIAYKDSSNVFTRNQAIFGSSPGEAVLRIVPASGQTSNLTSWFGDPPSGVPVASVSNTGTVFAQGFSAPLASFTSTSGGSVPLRVQAAASQFDPLTEWRSSTGTVLASVGYDGVFSGNGSGLSNVTASSSTPVAGDISGTIGNAQLAGGSVGSLEILNGSVSSLDIEDHTITGSDILPSTSLSIASVTATGSFINNPFGTSAGNTSEHRFLELAANGTNYVGFKSANNVFNNVIWTLPSTDGASNQVLSTNGAGVLSWTSPVGGGTVTNVATGSGLTGGPITGTGTISIASGGVSTTEIADGTITNTDISASAAIADSKLATIATAGKVSNSATTATSANIVSTIVARDASGNFSAGTITAALTGAASSNVLKAGDTMSGLLRLQTSAVFEDPGAGSFAATIQ
ncbi:MAG: hypothetical protein ACKORE_08360 [Bacteroidota bacterium]